MVKTLGKQSVHISPFVDTAARLMISLIGALFLLVPMVLMSLLPEPSQAKLSLVVTVVFVLFFAAAISLSTRASNQEVLAATAGYAAVLVVFVGSSFQGPS